MVFMISPPRRSTLFPYTTLFRSTFFTAGPKEVRAWTVRTGATAPQAAGVIHTDFERGFIRAEVIAFADRSEEHTSELQSLRHLVCRLLLEKKKKRQQDRNADKRK